MTITIESDLKEILLQMNQNISKIQTDVNDIKIEIVRLVENQKRFEQGLTDTNKRIDETNKRIDETNKRIDETNKRIDDGFGQINTRLNTITLGFLGIIGVFVAGVLTLISKIPLLN